MNAQKKEANSFRLLASQLKMDINTSLKLAEQVKEFAGNLPANEVSSKNPNIYAVALSLQHFYTSLETAFKRVVKELDGGVPTGDDWHKQLLDQVILDIEDVRPALISAEIKDKLDRLRRFRHIVRHGYEYELDWLQIKPIVETLDEIVPQLKKDFQEFIEFLVETARGIEGS